MDTLGPCSCCRSGKGQKLKDDAASGVPYNPPIQSCGVLGHWACKSLPEAFRALEKAAYTDDQQVQSRPHEFILYLKSASCNLRQSKASGFSASQCEPSGTRLQEVPATVVQFLPRESRARVLLTPSFAHVCGA